VSNLDHFNSAICVIDGVNDAKLPLANAIASLHSGKLFTPGWPWVGFKCSDSINDALAIPLLTKRLDLFSSRGLDE
jgi:hypothetical protein